MSTISASRLGIGHIIGFVAALTGRRSTAKRKFAGGASVTMSGAAIHSASLVVLTNTPEAFRRTFL